MARQALGQWIRLAMIDEDKDGKITQMALCHMIGAQPREIHTTKFSPAKSSDPEELAKMFWAKACAHAQDLSGTQTFELVAFYGGRTTPEAVRPFTVTPENLGNGLTTEQPTEAGERQQRMRINDGLISQVYRRQQAMDEHSLQLIGRISGMLEQTQKENRDMFGLFKEMMMEKVLDEHKREMEKRQFERDTVERRKWLSFIPPMCNTILGREIFPQATEDTALIEAIAESLTAEDIGKLSNVLPPTHWGLLAGRFSKYMDKKAEEEKSLKALGPHPDPEADAAGDAVGEPH